jgi:hypothetical protein
VGDDAHDSIPLTCCPRLWYTRLNQHFDQLIRSCIKVSFRQATLHCQQPAAGVDCISCMYAAWWQVAV